MKCLYCGKEIKEAEELLKASVEDLLMEEEIAEERKNEKSEDEKIQSLEEEVRKEQEIKAAKQPIYGEALEELKQEVHSKSDPDLYQELKQTFEKVQNGEYLSAEERQVLYTEQEEIEKNRQTTNDRDTDFGYVDRSKQVIDAINKAMDNSTYKGQY